MQIYTHQERKEYISYFGETKAKVIFPKEAKNVCGVVSGCYDLFHLGHLRSINYARNYIGEGVLCALTLKDEFIKRKKGETRPIFNLKKRVDMLSKVKNLDFVVVLDGPDCQMALQEMRPKYYFKSEEDLIQEAVKNEVEIVKKYGGETIFFPKTLKSRFSTTSIINELLGC